MKSAAIALVLLVAAPLAAQDRNVDFTVWYSQTESEATDFGTGFVTDFEDGSGYGLSATWRTNRWIAVEGAAFALRSDARLLFEGEAPFDLGRLNLTVFSAGAQFHILEGRFDPYIGAGGAYVIGDDFHTPDLDAVGIGRIELGNEFAYYLNAGLGIQITGGLGLVLDARYLPFETDARAESTGVARELDISPTIYSAGLRLRF